MAKYLLEDSNINWLAILALLTFFTVFSLALLLTLKRDRHSYKQVAEQPLKDSYSSHLGSDDDLQPNA
ncbi:MAG: hypothetical protein AAF828_02180 [Bacteroidota bacterium]